jgi:hypothetical protein
MASTLSVLTLGSVASLLITTLYQGDPYTKHKLWNIVSTKRYTFNSAGAAEMLLHINGKIAMS